MNVKVNWIMRVWILTVIFGCLAEIEKEHDIKPFFNAVRKFYVASICIQKMIQKFPFQDPLLKDQPEKTASYSVGTVLGLAIAKCFPQLIV